MQVITVVIMITLQVILIVFDHIQYFCDRNRHRNNENNMNRNRCRLHYTSNRFLSALVVMVVKENTGAERMENGDGEEN